MSEHNEQALFFEWLSLKLLDYPEIHPLFHAVPNGAHLAGGERQRAMQVNKLKREGLVPGVADTEFLSGRGGYFGLALEFKTESRRNTKDGGLSDAQMEFLRAAKMEGYLAVVAYGFDDAVEIVSKYLAMPKTMDMIYQALKLAKKGEPKKCSEILQDIVSKW